MKNAPSNRSSTNHLDSEHSKQVKDPTKLEVCLTLLFERLKTNTFNATWAYGDFCLHSTVPAIEKNHNIFIERVKKKAPRRKTKVNVAHYYLVGDNPTKAIKLVDSLRFKHNDKPLDWGVIA
jgi:hypothetical protein